MDILEHITEFKRKILAEGGDQKTAKTYANCLALMLKHYEAKYTSPLHITFRDMEDYIIHLSNRNFSPSYINQFIAAAKRYSQFLGHENVQTTRDYYHRLTLKGMQQMFSDIDTRLNAA